MNVLVKGKTADLGVVSKVLDNLLSYGGRLVPYNNLMKKVELMTDMFNSNNEEVYQQETPKKEVQPKEEPEKEVMGDFSFPLYQENGDSFEPPVVEHTGGSNLGYGRIRNWDNDPNWTEEMAKFTV